MWVMLSEVIWLCPVAILQVNGPFISMSRNFTVHNVMVSFSKYSAMIYFEVGNDHFVFS
ncbi:hypothetical protein KC19_5G163900 [Ceratodon purpureus]|uniref:Uncharacterized protein n=1 Tax=Ceratodon purpureus TaxID=3225 RepID=A0A8T0I344_CERPU|nr:hypothetical protein KC19_5G163900 [Ceratodon purpureus]